MSKEIEKQKRAAGEAAIPLHVEDLYQNWFLEYASYVILDRAIPDIRDGLKPVQRRILYALHELDDGRLNKVANVIGHTMRYHPHGDMAIEDALVKMGQKELLIDTQGNWGNTFTGDSAAAPRYIEGRLSKFSKEVLFQDELTSWQASYDGRNREPVVLPVKFPLLLALGVEGIAVGLATKILPHNYGELCEAAIAHLEGRSFQLLPDFASGGSADFENYREGQRGGRVRVRARIEVFDPKTLVIRDLPFGVTTSTLIDSILSAHDKSKIKIKKVEDNTSREVEIRIHLPPGVPAASTVDALYAFTDCEISIATHACVIRDERPHFCSTTELLIDAAERTRELLRQELELEQAKLEQKIKKASLEQLFIEQKVYRKVEGAASWDEALEKLRKGLAPFLKDFAWQVTDQDYEALLELRFKRLTLYDSSEAAAQLEALQKQLKATQKKLSKITAHAIAYFRSLKERYGQGPRRTRIETFGEIKAREVVIANQKLYVNRAEGFLGTSLKKDEFISECSDLDEVLVIRRGGQATLVKVSDKCFVGEDIFYLQLLPASGAESCLHILYRDLENGHIWGKRQRLGPMQKDRAYELVKSGAEVLYARLWEGSPSEWLELERAGANEPWLFNFASLPFSPRAAKGQKLSERALLGFKNLGTALEEPARQLLYWDKKNLRISLGGGGQKLGQERPAALIYTVSRDGCLSIAPAAESRTLTAPLLAWGPWLPGQTHTAVFGTRAKQGQYSVRRFKAEDFADGSEIELFTPDEGDELLWYSVHEKPLLWLEYRGELPPELLPLGECVPVKGLASPAWKLSRPEIKSWQDVSGG